MIVAPQVEVPGLVARDALSERQCDEMFALLNRHFDGVTRAQFARDLAAKNWIIALHRSDRLVGFTSLQVTTAEFSGATVTVIYSGDTIVAPEAWGTPALARAWITGVNRIRAEFPQRECYWLLLTSGFRTYRFLPVFWKEFYPHYQTPTPSAQHTLLCRLAHEAYAPHFDPAAGLVRFPQPQRLRGPLAVIPEGRVANPHVAFFLARNPGHGDGDELVCLTKISEANLTPAGRRMVAAPE